MSQFNQTPCFWTSTQIGFNDADRSRPKIVNGRRLLEKFPQSGHLGDYDGRVMAPGIRYLRMIRHDGNEVFHVLTNAAGHMDHTTPWGQYQMQKARFLGWFGRGECPCALVASRTISGETIVAEGNKGAQPCQPDTYSVEKPCKHALDEIAARLAAHKALNDERAAAVRDDNARMIEAQNKQAEAIKDLAAAMLAKDSKKKGD